MPPELAAAAAAAGARKGSGALFEGWIPQFNYKGPRLCGAYGIYAEVRNCHVPVRVYATGCARRTWGRRRTAKRTHRNSTPNKDGCKRAWTLTRSIV